MDLSSSPTSCQAPVPRGGTERALAVLKELARHPQGTSLETLAQQLRTPKSSVHRALAALVRAGLATHPRPDRYVLGSEFVRLAYAHAEARQESRLLEPCLQELTETYGETAHYAELEGPEVVYRAKVTPAHQNVQMTSTIGGRNPAFCTGIGKALLAHELAASRDQDALVKQYGPLVPRTPKTLADPKRFIADLRATLRRGYALDDEESELGINCIAFAVFLDSPTVPSGAVSVAALKHRLALDDLERNASAIRAIIERHLGRVLQ
jgi:IclR family acetate operon transcriptional repressor